MKRVMLLLCFCFVSIQAQAGLILATTHDGYSSYNSNGSNTAQFRTLLNAASDGLTVVGNPLDNLSQLLNYDSIWVNLRGTSSVLSAGEVSALSSFIATGRRVLFIGEHSGWATWNNSFLGMFGGTSGVNGGAANIVLSNPLTAGVTQIAHSGGSSTGGLNLDSTGLAALWGPSNNVLTVLDTNFYTNSSSSNTQFNDNIANWLGKDFTPANSNPIPEPATLGLFGLALLAMRRFTKK